MYRYTPKYAVFCIFILSLLSLSSKAHGELTERINEKTAEIKLDPNNSTLYFERGFLYQQHEEPHKALNDYLKAEEFGYSDKVIHFRKATVYQVLASYELAMNSVADYFEINDVDVKIYKLKAQILADQKKYKEALISYDYVLEHTIDIRPQEYIEYCKFLLAYEPGSYEKALAVIELGLDKLGEQSFNLRLKKIEYLKQLQKYEEVIEEYNGFIFLTERKENWYYQKALYLHEINRNSEAQIALQQAKMSIQLLSSRFQQTPNIQNLTSKVNELEKKLPQ